jgi:hypothetical protein
MAVRMTSPIRGPRRGEVEQGDQVMIDRPDHPTLEEGQVVAKTPDGKVRVSVFDATVEREVDECQVWQKEEQVIP